MNLNNPFKNNEGKLPATDNLLRLLNKKIEATSNQGKFEGLTSYRIHIRLLNQILTMKGADMLLEHIKQNPIPTLDAFQADLINNTNSHNEDLFEKVQNDRDAYPSKIALLQTLIQNMNNSQTAEQAKTNYQALEDFFDK